MNGILNILYVQLCNKYSTNAITFTMYLHIYCIYIIASN